MKRPFALMGFTYLTTLAAANFLGLNAAVMLSGIFALLALFSFIIPKLRRSKVIPIAAVCALIASLSYSAAYAFVYQPATDLNGETLSINAMVLRAEHEEAFDKYYYDLAATIPTEHGNRTMRFRLSCDHDTNCVPGDTVEFDAVFSLPPDSSGYSTRMYQRSRRIYLYCYSKGSIDVISSHKGIMYYSHLAKEALSNSIDSLLSKDTAGVVKGIFLGDSSPLPYSTIKSFRMSGIAHLLAVSGLHVSILSSFLLSLFKRLRLKHSISSLLTSVSVLAFMAITGFSPSVTRAGIMCIIYCIGKGIGRKSDSLNSLGFAVLVVTLINPFVASNLSLLLSFSATLGIILASSRIRAFMMKPFYKSERLKRVVSPIISTVSTTFSAIAFTLPITILFIGNISLIAPVTNLICTIPAYLIFICGALAAITNLVPFLPFISMPLAFIAGICSKFVLAVSDFLSRLPLACVSAQDFYIKLWLCGALALLIFAVLIHRRKAVAISLLLSVICILGGILSHSILYGGVCEIAVIDQEDSCSVVIAKGNDAIVIGCGGSYDSFNRVEDFLESRAVRDVRLLILPSTDDDFAGGAEDIITAYQPESIMTYDEGEYIDEIMSCVSYTGAVSDIENCKLTLRNDISIDITEANGQSAYVIKYKDTSILFSTKDMDLLPVSEEMSNPDVVIYQYELPANFQEITPAIGIIAGKTDKSSQAMLRLRKFANDCYLSGDYGRLVIQTRGEHDIMLREEG